MSEHSLDLALIRWSVVCRSWNELAAGNDPHLGAFLAGWFSRVIDAPYPKEMFGFRDSFRSGWKEADDQIAINNQTKQP